MPIFFVEKPKPKPVVTSKKDTTDLSTNLTAKKKDGTIKHKNPMDKVSPNIKVTKVIQKPK